MADLGVKVQTLDVLLSVGSGYVAGLHRQDDTDWALTDSLELRFSDSTVWPATLLGSNATWAETEAAVSALITAAPDRVELWYLSSLNNIPIRWTRGCVEVQR